jgi:hypothetical protein
MSTERCLGFLFIDASLSVLLFSLKYRAYVVCFKRVFVRQTRRIFEVVELVSAPASVLMVIS